MSTLDADFTRIIKNLRGLDAYLDGQIKGKKIFDKAARIVVAEMKRQAPEYEGVLKTNIKKITSRKSKNSVIVGSKFPQKNRPSNHAWLAEHGHKTPNGKYVPGTPYVRRTFEATKEQIKSNIITELKAAFDRAGKSSAGFI